MSRDLLNISLDDFRNLMYQFNNKALIQTFEDICKYKKENWGRWNPMYIDHFTKINDLERKTTMIEGEMQRRGIVPSVSDGDKHKEYIQWQQKNFWKKNKW